MTSFNDGRIRPDVFSAAATLRREFGLTADNERHLANCLPSFRPERFRLPYADGADLARERPLGIEQRNLLNMSHLPAGAIIHFDPMTFELAGMLEYIDRHGRHRSEALLKKGSDQLLVSHPRTEPISDADMLPPLREALACLYEAMTDRKPAKKDYRKIPGGRGKVAVRLSPAHFIRAALCSLGWTYTDADVARYYRNLLTIPWRLSDFT